MDNRQKYININPKYFELLSLSYFDKYMHDALIYRDFMGCEGFKEDYLALHGIIREVNPQSFCEIGTHLGEGTRIICNAMQGKQVYSLDLPVRYDETKDVYLNWNSEKPEGKVGERCEFTYTQLFGNSKDFDFSPYYPIDAWYIDGRHNYEFCYVDSINALKSNPKVIIWHDTLMDGVQKAIYQIIEENKALYEAYYIRGTRVSFILRKEKNNANK
jgi:hypothetical protein